MAWLDNSDKLTPREEKASARLADSNRLGGFRKIFAFNQYPAVADMISRFRNLLLLRRLSALEKQVRIAVLDNLSTVLPILKELFQAKGRQPSTKTMLRINALQRLLIQRSRQAIGEVEPAPMTAPRIKTSSHLQMLKLFAESEPAVIAAPATTEALVWRHDQRHLEKREPIVLPTPRKIENVYLHASLDRLVALLSHPASQTVKEGADIKLSLRNLFEQNVSLASQWVCGASLKLATLPQHTQQREGHAVGFWQKQNSLHRLTSIHLNMPIMDHMDHLFFLSKEHYNAFKNLLNNPALHTYLHQLEEAQLVKLPEVEANAVGSVFRP